MREVPKALTTAEISKGILQQTINSRSDGKNVRDKMGNPQRCS